MVRGREEAYQGEVQRPLNIFLSRVSSMLILAIIILTESNLIKKVLLNVSAILVGVITKSCRVHSLLVLLDGISTVPSMSLVTIDSSEALKVPLYWPRT